jgi:hypothetical protein
MTTTNLPATTDNHVLALADDEWGDVEVGYVGEAPPTAAPVVPRFTFNAKSDGGFYDELDETRIGAGESLRCVVLLWSESRAYWKEEFGKGETKSPTCRSTNMIVPDDASLEKQSATCAACPHSKWGTGPKNEPPACNLRINVMLYLPESQRIVRTAFGGLALKYVQRYLGGFATRLPQRPPMAFITEILVDKQDTDNGVFLVPKFKIAGDISRAEAAPLIALRDELRKQWEALSAEDLHDRGDDKAAGPFDSDDQVVDGEVFDDEEPF